MKMIPTLLENAVMGRSCIHGDRNRISKWKCIHGYMNMSHPLKNKAALVVWYCLTLHHPKATESNAELLVFMLACTCMLVVCVRACMPIIQYNSHLITICLKQIKY